MNIVILARNSKVYTVGKLLEEFAFLGHPARLVVPSRCRVYAKSGVFYNGKWLETPDAVLQRFSSGKRHLANKVLQEAACWHWLLQGTICLNEPVAGATASNKFVALEILRAHDIPTPRTVFAAQFRDKPFPGEKFVVKTRTGAMGKGVTLTQSWEDARSQVEQSFAARKPAFVQKYMRGRNYRMVVVGDQVIGTTRRTPAKGEFRANIHLGATARSVDVPEAYKQLAVKATQVLGLHYSGVDLIETDSGIYVLEVNPIPGLVPETPDSPNMVRMLAQYVIKSVEDAKARKANL